MLAKDVSSEPIVFTWLMEHMPGASVQITVLATAVHFRFVAAMDKTMPTSVKWKKLHVLR